MIEILLSNIDQNATNEEKKNQLRENLQILILKILSDKGLFKNISFMGGTSLRIIHGINRFSEDLDFTLDRKYGFDFLKTIKYIQKTLSKINISYTVKIGGKNIVKFAFFKFPDLLYELKISNLKEQNLNIKIEIDIDPPAGAKKEVTLINKFYIFSISNYDISSLFAGKLYAILFRKYTKARDYYDLLWFLTKKVKVNYTLLNNAVKQTEKKDFKIDKIKLKSFLLDKIKKLDFNYIKNDIIKYLININELELLTKRNFEKLIIENFD